MKVPGKKLTDIFVIQWIIVLMACIVVRLPYFLSKHCSFDGDEAIVGIMAQDLLAGRNIGIYFYGQQYGFSFFEVLGVAIGILIFGNTVWAIKFGGLVVFATGITFLFKSFLKKQVPILWAMLAMIIVSAFPVWIIWAAKARGGYVTAFTAVCMIFYITQLKDIHAKQILAASFLMAIAIHSQLLIAVAVAPLMFVWIIQSERLKFIILIGVSFGIFWFLLKLPAHFNDHYWTISLSPQYNFHLLVPIFKDLYKAALGYFYYEMTFLPTRGSLITGIGYYLLAVLCMIVAFFRKENTKKMTFILLGAGAVDCFFLVMYMKVPSYRYFLGTFTALLLMLVLSMTHMKLSSLKYGLVCLLVCATGFSFTARHIPDAWMLPEGNDMKSYNGLIHELKQRNIQHVFATDGLLQWMLCYSGIPARYTSKTERINRFLDEVDKCYRDQSCKTAIVGFKGFPNYMDRDDWDEKVMIVNVKYFILYNPTDTILNRSGFEFR